MKRIILVSLILMLLSCQEQESQKVEDLKKDINIQIDATAKLPSGNEKTFEIKQTGFNCSVVYPKTSYSKPLIVVLVNMGDHSKRIFETEQRNLTISPGKYKLRFSKRGDEVEKPPVFPAGIGVTVSLDCLREKK